MLSGIGLQPQITSRVREARWGQASLTAQSIIISAASFSVTLEFQYNLKFDVILTNMHVFVTYLFKQKTENIYLKPCPHISAFMILFLPGMHY